MPVSFQVLDRLGGRLLFLGLAWLVLAACIAAGCFTPAHRLPTWLPNDKLLHFGAYFALAFPMAFVTQSWSRLLLIAIGLSIAGFLIEIVQRYIPGRDSSIADMVANTGGVVMGIGAGYMCLALHQALPDSLGTLL